MADLVKAGDIQFVAQLNNFKTKIVAYVVLFGLTPAQVSSIAADEEWLSFVVLRNNGVPGFAQDWTRLKNQVRFGGDGTIIPPFPTAPDVTTPPMTPIEPNVEGRFRTLVAQIKANSNYSKTIGEELGIEIAETDLDEENYKPKGSAKAVLTDVTVKFNKKGVDGVAIYSRVITGAAKAPTDPAPPTAGELNEFKKIATDYHSPYIDNRPLAVAGQAETREYYLRGIVNDAEIGVPSDVIKVAVGA